MSKYQYFCKACEQVFEIYQYDKIKRMPNPKACEWCGSDRLRLEAYYKNTDIRLRELQDTCEALYSKIEQLEAELDDNFISPYYISIKINDH